MKRKCKPTFSCLYIAHFAIHNNLFYRFPKLEAGGGPETKHFIGVALTTATDAAGGLLESPQGYQG